MKFLITGGTGQLGYDLRIGLLEKGINEENILVPKRCELDITKEEVVKNYILNNKPDVIFHCAAYTAVDRAEEEKDLCFDINVNGTKYLTEYASKIGAKIIYISTDYVFDGTKNGEYNPSDITSPINYYGKTKYQGEEIVGSYYNHVIVRISWVFGINGKNFIKTMLNLSKTNKELSVVSDQIGSPTYTEDLAKLLIKLSISDIKGTIHATNEGFCSWYDLAKYIFEVNNLDVDVNPILTKDYKTLAKRPLNSKLNKDCLDEYNLGRLPTWQDAVLRYCRILKKEDKERR